MRGRQHGDVKVMTPVATARNGTTRASMMPDILSKVVAKPSGATKRAADRCDMSAPTMRWVSSNPGTGLWNQKLSSTPERTRSGTLQAEVVELALDTGDDLNIEVDRTAEGSPRK